ncbi:MAG: LysR family transcriptional regulator [Alphaproteobacteria bacterium]|nr:LysR family transcriptional regulator [Alphaproteobacteria bacterium]MBU1515965.1 LysR family transcriptional regulator [Alphaproteobacteria bacterium]MBU2092820.1 LysR family transcriptional regulator [Alphaproteobacteria bacterium]MBU2153655.1 LysR family transcriptional regulator [Alphaproteobacteria bacterium]MBU2308283.1 LysR family transcriptional regulator [Alphaproteobacteria bacterium]
MLDDLNELRTFQRIVALGSLSAAARDLGVGVAVVSKRLTALERRAGQRLVHRTTRKLSLTEEGLALLPHVDLALDALAAAEAGLTGGRDAPHGVLRVSAPISLGRIHVAPVLAALTERHPRLTAELLLDDRMVDMTETRIDVAVRIGPPQDSTAILHWRFDNHRILVATPDYLARRGRPGAIEDLSDHECLRYDPAVPWRLEGPGGVAVEVGAMARLRANSGDVVQDWALAGFGIALKSQADVAVELASGRMERVLPDWRSAAAPIYALSPSARHTPAKSRAFLDAMSAHLNRIALA